MTVQTSDARARATRLRRNESGLLEQMSALGRKSAQARWQGWVKSEREPNRRRGYLVCEALRLPR